MIKALSRLLRPGLRAVAVFALALCTAQPADARPYADWQALRPDLFDPATGFRIARQRAPVPDDIPPPAQLATPEKARALLQDGALALDVFAALQSRFDELDGTWLVGPPRLSLPGAVWLPEVGRGRLEPILQRYLQENLGRLAPDRKRPIVVFCVADCWMSWNAAQRIAGLGYARVYWFRLGTDGWLDLGETLEEVSPIPVTVDD